LCFSVARGGGKKKFLFFSLSLHAPLCFCDQDKLPGFPPMSTFVTLFRQQFGSYSFVLCCNDSKAFVINFQGKRNLFPREGKVWTLIAGVTYSARNRRALRFAFYIREKVPGCLHSGESRLPVVTCVSVPVLSRPFSVLGNVDGQSPTRPHPEARRKAARSARSTVRRRKHPHATTSQF
jgi:hypothetical protein